MIIQTIKNRIDDRFYCLCRCDNCNIEFRRTRSKTIRSNYHLCSLKCRDLYKKANPEYQAKANQKRSIALKGSKSYLWNGGKRIYGNYTAIYKPEHPYCNKAGYVMEHRLIMEKFLNRFLKPIEQVHHLNGITNDNKIENLMLFANNGEHQKYHWNLAKAL